MFLTLALIIHCFPGLYDDFNGCCDPLLQLTTVTTFAESGYQYFYVGLSGCVLLSTSLVLELMRTSERTQRAEAVLRCLNHFIDQACTHQKCLRNWYTNANSEPGSPSAGQTTKTPSWRRVATWLVLIPMLVLVSLPAMMYVLSQNVPKGSSFIIFLVGNSTTVAVINTLVNSLVIPPTVTLLSKLKYGPTTGNTPDTMIRIYRFHVSVALLFQVHLPLSMFLTCHLCLDLQLSAF